MNEVKITVEGQLGTGKTTIAAAISAVLKNFGYHVTYEPKDVLDTVKLNPIDTDKAQRTHVTIEEKQLPRVP